MDNITNDNYQCVLQNIKTMKISLITHIFAYSSNFPFRFLYIISKSKKMKEIINSLLANILLENKLSLECQSYINKYKLAQKIYLPISEKIIEQKINGFSFTFPELKSFPDINPKDKYAEIIYNNLKEELYEKYNSLEVFCNDIKYQNKKNKWFLKKISDKNNIYFNNCSFIIDDIESIEVIIYLLYYNNYLNFKNIIKIKKINTKEKIKFILDDKNIKYILEYPRAIIINNQFIYQLMKSNINFYICSFNNINRLFNITFQNKINLNNNIYNISNKKEHMIINKPHLSFKEINLYLKEYETIGVDSLEFKNFLIQSSIYDYFFGNYKKNKKGENDDNINRYDKNLNNNLRVFNFGNDFFEIKENSKIYILHCSEIINYINNSHEIINLYLYNFPVSHLKKIKNKLIEFLSIENFFNFDNDINFCINNINKSLPKIKKIKIKYFDYYYNKSITYIKAYNNFHIKNIIINLKGDKIKLNYNLNNIDLHEIFYVIESFEGINSFNFGLGNIMLSEKKENDGYIKINMVLNENSNYILKEADVNILRFLNFENLLIYGHILNGIKPLQYYFLDENNNDIIEELNLNENINIIEIINKSFNNFSESNFSLIFNGNYFYLPFIENLIIKINLKKVTKLLSNCIFGNELNLYNINIDSLYNIKTEKIKKLNIYLLNSIDNEELNIRYIYHNIPSLLNISINLYNTKIVFKKDDLSFLYFKIRYKFDNIFNKKVIILDFENNNFIYEKIRKKHFNVHSKDLVIFKFNDEEKIVFKDKKIIKNFNMNFLDIFRYIYILTLIVLLFIIIISNLY